MCKASYLIRNPKAGIAGQREMLPIPCGKCKECIQTRVLSWQFRLEQEAKVSSSALFVTLTYDEDNVPKHQYDTGEFNVLKPKDLTNYFKLLRKWTKSPLRYYAVGEYGKKFHRPHYHIILFNCSDVRNIQDQWKFGHVDIRPYSSIGAVPYVLKYLFKKVTYCPPQHKPFSRMSKGLGKNYLNPEVISYHKRKMENVCVSLDSGHKLALPKYFKDKVYNEQERRKLSLYMQRRMDEMQEERVEKIVRDSNADVKVVLNSIDREVKYTIFDKDKLERPTIF